MEQLYFLDIAGTCTQVMVTMTIGSCVTVEQYTSNNGETFLRKEVELTFTIPAPLSEPVQVRYRIERLEQDDWGTQNLYWTNYSVTIPAGDINVVAIQVCYVEIYEDFGAGGWAYLTEEAVTYEILPQITLPAVCTIQDPTCNLEILDVNTTHPTIRGETGTIQVDTLGGVGNHTYKLNGITRTTTGGASYTYTAVPSGTHVITVEDSEGCIVQQTGIVIQEGDFRTGDFSISQPAKILAVHNPIIHNVSTFQATTQERRARARITVKNETIVDGARIVFSFTKPMIYEVTFYARGFPNRNNYFLASEVKDFNGVVQGANTRSEIAQSIGEVLSNDIFISQNYDISISTDYVTLTAKQTGSKYDLNAANVFIRDENNLDTINYFTLSVQATGLDRYDGEIVDNYSIYGEVFINTNIAVQYPDNGGSLDYKKAAELSIPFQNNNRHFFDVSAILQNYVSTPKPFFEFSGYTVLPDMMRPYFIRFGESYPIVSNSNTVKKRFKTETLKRWFINSALPHYSANDMNDYEGKPITYLNADFTITQTSQNLTITNVIDDAYTGMTTAIVYQLKDSDGNVVRVYQASNVFTNVITDNYIIEVRGLTDGTGFSVFKRFRMLGAPSLPIAERRLPTIPTINGKFLTNSPVVKQIQRQQNEYLYFMIRKDFGYPITLQGDIYYYDGSVDMNETFFNITTTNRNAGGVFVLNLSYDKLGLDVYENQGGNIKKIKYVDVQVRYDLPQSGIVNMSEMKRYSFAINEQPRKYGVVFQNVMGGYDTYDFIGIVENEIDRQYGEFTVVTQPNVSGAYSQGFKESAVYNTQITRQITCNTGYLNKEHLEWLKELLNSNDIYDYTEENQHYLKVVDYKYIESSQEDLFDMEVTFRHTTYENNIKI